MALIKCPECGQSISDQSDVCIHCGFPLNKANRVAPQTKNKERIPTRIVAFRAEDCGTSIKVLAIITTVFSVLFLGLAIAGLIFSLLNKDYFFLIYSALFLVLSILLIIAATSTFSKIKNNKNIHNDCIIYNHEQQSLTLFGLNSKTVKIKLEDYVSLKDNFFTDNCLIVTYRDSSQGQQKKINLGYCANREEVRGNIASIKKMLEAQQDQQDI